MNRIKLSIRVPAGQETMENPIRSPCSVFHQSATTANLLRFGISAATLPIAPVLELEPVRWLPRHPC